MKLSVSFKMFSLVYKRLPNVLKLQQNVSKCTTFTVNRNCSSSEDNRNKNVTDHYDRSEFRKLELYPSKNPAAKERFKRKFTELQPRYKRMSVKQKWSNVWPGPRSFHPATVPLPIRQGYINPLKDKRPPPDKFANAELMKIPNFLHLTPPAIEQQCTAIKKYCTKWPAELETTKDCEQYFPIEYVSTDYVHGLPTIRNPLSRIISLRVKLSALPLDGHAKDKFLRLVENRYDIETDIVTITVDRCPIRKQNYEYAQYLLAALFHESFIIEPWESMKVEADMEYYDWNKNQSKESVEEILRWGKSKDEPITVTMDAFAKSVEAIFNEGENETNLQNYKEETLKLLGLRN